MDTMIQQVKQYIQKYNLIVPGDRVLLSLSAGKDSMAMLDILYKLQTELVFTIGCFHLNHLTRGTESDMEEAFVTRRTREYGLPLYNHRHNFGSLHGSFEQQAREVRYSYLEELAGKHNYNRIATAHNNNDNVETILMRLFTGTGINGLRGIPRKNGKIIRPLLEVSVEYIYNYLNSNRLTWCEDSSNTEEIYQRNKVRNQLVPAINNIFPGMEKALVALCRRADEQLQLTSHLVYAVYGDITFQKEEAFYIKIDNIIHNKTLLYHIITEALRENFSHFVTYNILEEMYRNLNSKKSNLQLYRDKTIIIKKVYRNSTLYIKISGITVITELSDWEYPVSITDIGQKVLFIDPLNITLLLQTVDCNFYENNKTNKAYLFINLQPQCKQIVLRNRKEGDRAVFNNQTKKIKDLLIEKKLDNNSKNFVPILVIDNEIAAFCPGLVFLDLENRVVSSFYVQKNSKKILAISRISE